MANLVPQMKKLVLILLSVSTVLCLIGTSMQDPEKTKQAYYREHNRLERMLERKEGSEEFRDAVWKERMYMSNAETIRSLGRLPLWLALSANLAALAVVLVGWKKTPPEPPPGSLTPAADAPVVPPPGAAHL